MAGEIALKSPGANADSTEAHFERALAVAREQHAKSWELRAAISMARLWRDQGKRDAARDLLTPVYGSFTEGFDTLDLKEAKTLLNCSTTWHHEGRLGGEVVAPSCSRVDIVQCSRLSYGPARAAPRR